MGAELMGSQNIRMYGAAPSDISPWQAAMPRVKAYLRAAGYRQADGLPAALAEIESHLQSLLPLHEWENPVEIAIRETVQWVEERQPGASAGVPPGADATPDRAGLPMPEQKIELAGWRRSRRARLTQIPTPDETKEREPSSEQRRSETSGPARGIRARRTVFFSLIGATTAGAIALLGGSMQQEGLNPLELLLILLYAVLFAWICAAFWTAFLGFVVRLFRIRRWDLETYAETTAMESDGTPGKWPRSVLVMPIYDEAPEYVFARLRAMWESLAKTPAGASFDLFILSDTRDPDIWVEEELHWQKLCDETNGKGRIFYRNRPENTYRKSGNIADFIEAWGDRYRYMAVLDADSLMSGETLQRMVAVMEAEPRVAVLQVPPLPVNNRSLFSRILQFASALYGPLYSTGVNFWQAGDANYYGHNAMIRVEAFARHCGLPSLPGSTPFGGPILSHDFVEAATLRRAGWEVWFANSLGGSFEEIPPTLIDYAKRDRRWCQGNLQHGRLIGARGWRGLSRVHLSMGVMSYLASPLWFLFLLAAGIEAWLQSRETPVYFFGHSLFPTWPASYAFELMTVLLVTLSILFLPKLLALILLLLEPGSWRKFGAPLRATSSVILESLFSVLVAPVLMLFQTKFVTAILLRRSIGWPTQQRVDRRTTLGEAMMAHKSQLLFGIVAGVVTWVYVPSFFWWFTPVLAGILLAVPVSMLSSRVDLGLAARRLGLFLTPEEVAPDEVVRCYRAIIDESIDESAPAEEDAGAKSGWLAALLQPHVYALHRRMLPEEEPTRRQRHHLQGLMYTLADESAEALTSADRRAMLTNRECLQRIHIGLWTELSMDRLLEATAP